MKVILALTALMILMILGLAKPIKAETKTEVVVEEVQNEDYADETKADETITDEIKAETAETQAEEEEKEKEEVKKEEEEKKEDESRIRILKETDISILSANCMDGVCNDFIYDDPREVVFFQAKPHVRFTSRNTYVIKDPPKYGVLRFVDSKFTNFPLNLFYSVRIEELDMRNCSIEHMTWDNFLNADELSILLLSDNSLREIKPMTFSNAGNLAFLFLDSNEITTLHRESFKGLPHLFLLDLHGNRLETLSNNLFSYLPALQQLNLADNRLRVIYDETFADNPRLSTLNLQRNYLESLGEYAFQNQKYMDYVDLSHNRPLQSLVGNIHVDNLWATNCSLTRVNIYGKAKNVDLQHNHIMELYFTQPENIETLRLKDNSLEQVASLIKATNLIYFDVSDNPHLEYLPQFWEADSLERLDLSNTSLSAILPSVIQSPERLKSLNVSYNRLQQIDPLQFQYFEKLQHFFIHHNDWNCYNLQLLMDMVIRPFEISYTLDEYDEDFPGEYIGGIKCMYRLIDNEKEMDDEPQSDRSFRHLSSQLNQADEKENGGMEASEVDLLRREFKAVVGIYEQKFSLVQKKLEDLDKRLKKFEKFNNTIWQHVTITV